MKWSQLYSPRRTSHTSTSQRHRDESRTDYIRDYDRIIFSSAFRRLQNKTQVFPLPGAVFVHNRLTHSLEVASVGRSLGKVVGEFIASKQENDPATADFYKHELGAVIAGACLAHDIGNPPFGHAGEDAIRSYFEGLKGRSKERFSTLSEAQQLDFLKFEGNSNALRILTKSNSDEPLGGYGLTYSTLAAIVKYPCTAKEGFVNNEIARKKSGYFESELEIWNLIATELCLPKREGLEQYARHPFVFLTEAADDICYRIVDLEDAHRLSIISLEEFIALFLPFFDEAGDEYGTQNYVLRKLEGFKDANKKAAYLRALWIGRMIELVKQAFLHNETALLEGKLNVDLLGCLPKKERLLIKKINEVSVEKVYQHPQVVRIEVAGFNVIGGLLHELIEAILQPDDLKSKITIKLIPEQYPLQLASDSLYEDLQSVTDFVSSMTDLYALDLYRTISGISIPEIR